MFIIDNITVKLYYWCLLYTNE